MGCVKQRGEDERNIPAVCVRDTGGTGRERAKQRGESACILARLLWVGPTQTNLIVFSTTELFSRASRNDENEIASVLTSTTSRPTR